MDRCLAITAPAGVVSGELASGIASWAWTFLALLLFAAPIPPITVTTFPARAGIVTTSSAILNGYCTTLPFHTTGLC